MSLFRLCVGLKVPNVICGARATGHSFTVQEPVISALLWRAQLNVSSVGEFWGPNSAGQEWWFTSVILLVLGIPCHSSPSGLNSVRFEAIFWFNSSFTTYLLNESEKNYLICLRFGFLLSKRRLLGGLNEIMFTKYWAQSKLQKRLFIGFASVAQSH